MERFSYILLSFFILSSCSNSESITPELQVELPELVIQDVSLVEQDQDLDMTFVVTLTKTSMEDVSFSYTVLSETAEADVDFESTNGTGMIPAGDSKIDILITILADDKREIHEEFFFKISNAQNAIITDDRAIGIIRDQDEVALSTDSEGYITDENHFGYSIVWNDEFEGAELNLEDYNFDLGDGCPEICGWGNNELELYTDKPENIKLLDGKLVITATNTNGVYESAKIHTKDKQEFRFGRFDIRAKLPEGQGIWPAIWMLGSNIYEVGWPACGEIDIMELVGHEPTKSHGTAHWGPQSGPNSFQGLSYTNNKKFSEQFHVFSLVWEANNIDWYVDEHKFFTLTPDAIGNEVWRFNQSFYMIMNVAVGGNWPGYPNETTVFPQQMEIDYVRVFQRD